MASADHGISVLMAVHQGDNPSHLREALVSLVEQSRVPDEVVLVHDGPLHGAVDGVVHAYRDRLAIRRVTVPERRGLGNALAVGLEACRGELVARMDADDVSEPQRLETLEEAFAMDPELAVVGSTARIIDEAGDWHGVLRVPLECEQIFSRVWACPFIHPAVMFRRDAILGVGSYDPRLWTRQDYDLWFRCVEACLKMRNLEEPLIRYRISSQPKNRRFGIVWRQAVIGWRGCRLVGAPFRAWVGVTAPVGLYFLPKSISARIRGKFKFS